MCMFVCTIHYNRNDTYISCTMIWYYFSQQDGGSPLMEASQNGHVQVVAELLQHGARVDLQDKVWSFCISSLLLVDLFSNQHSHTLLAHMYTNETRLMHSPSAFHYNYVHVHVRICTLH